MEIYGCNSDAAEAVWIVNRCAVVAGILIVFICVVEYLR